MIINSRTKLERLLRDCQGDISGGWNVRTNNYEFTITKDGVPYRSRSNDGRVALMALLELEFPEYNCAFVLQMYEPAIPIVDLLWNKYHPDILKTRGVGIRATAIKEIQTRARNANNYLSDNVMLDNLISHGYNPVGQIQNLQENYDHINNKPIYFIAKYNESCDGTYTPFPVGKFPDQLGYIEGDGEWMSPASGLIEYDGQKYARATMRTCVECSASVPKTKLFKHLCKACLGIDPALVTIRGYQDRAPSFLNYKIGKYSKALYKEPLCFGIELEYESTDVDSALLDTVRLLHDHAIIKRDGSIRDGFEIVTTPATRDHHEIAFSNFFNKFPKHLKTADNVGMHIHVSRKPLNYLTQGKMVEFMNRLDNKPLIELVAGRANNGYCRQSLDRSISYPFTHKTGERYNTLNINNEATLEFRIFSTPKTYGEFIPRLEFVDAVTAFCSPCQGSYKSLKDATHFSSFLTYVESNKHTWKNLYSLLFSDQIKARNLKLKSHINTKGAKACA